MGSKKPQPPPGDRKPTANEREAFRTHHRPGQKLTSPPPPPAMARQLSVSEVMQRTGEKRRHVLAWINGGQLDAVKVGWKWSIAESELERFARRLGMRLADIEATNPEDN